MATSAFTLVHDPARCAYPVRVGARTEPCGKTAVFETKNEPCRHWCREHHYLELLNRRDRLRKAREAVHSLERAVSDAYSSPKEARRSAERAARISSGRCGKCGADPRPGRKLCPSCTQKQDAANRRYRSSLKETG